MTCTQGLFACASLLEMMLESSLSDLRDAQGVSLPFCPSLVRLLRLLQDFLFAEGTDNHTLWSEKVYHILHLTHTVCSTHDTLCPAIGSLFPS